VYVYAGEPRFGSKRLSITILYHGIKKILYRLNKAQLHETISSDHGQWAVMYIYVAKNIDDLNMIPKSMIKVNNKLLKVITSKS